MLRGLGASNDNVEVNPVRLPLRNNVFIDRGTSSETRYLINLPALVALLFRGGVQAVTASREGFNHCVGICIGSRNPKLNSVRLANIPCDEMPSEVPFCLSHPVV